MYIYIYIHIHIYIYIYIYNVCIYNMYIYIYMQTIIAMSRAPRNPDLQYGKGCDRGVRLITVVIIAILLIVVITTILLIIVVIAILLIVIIDRGVDVQLTMLRSFRCVYIYIYIYINIYHQGNQHIRESRIVAPVGPRMQAAGLQCLKLQIAVAFPDPQTRAFPGTELSRKTRSPNNCERCNRNSLGRTQDSGNRSRFWLVAPTPQISSMEKGLV